MRVGRVSEPGRRSRSTEGWARRAGSGWMQALRSARVALPSRTLRAAVREGHRQPRSLVPPRPWSPALQPENAADDGAAILGMSRAARHIDVRATGGQDRDTPRRGRGGASLAGSCRNGRGCRGRDDRGDLPARGHDAHDSAHRSSGNLLWHLGARACKLMGTLLWLMPAIDRPGSHGPYAPDKPLTRGRSPQWSVPTPFDTPRSGPPTLRAA
jgi:hypothetical protein